MVLESEPPPLGLLAPILTTVVAITDFAAVTSSSFSRTLKYSKENCETPTVKPANIQRNKHKIVKKYIRFFTHQLLFQCKDYIYQFYLFTINIPIKNVIKINKTETLLIIFINIYKVLC